jgi:hypothetical protein
MGCLGASRCGKTWGSDELSKAHSSHHPAVEAAARRGLTPLGVVDATLPGWSLWGRQWWMVMGWLLFRPFNPPKTCNLKNP